MNPNPVMMVQEFLHQTVFPKIRKQSQWQSQLQ